MHLIYESIYRFLEEGKPLVLATILTKTGSAPREEGTKMIIRKDNTIVGTIGGGMLEAMAMKIAAEVFETGRWQIREFNLTNGEAGNLGMVCGGEVTVLLECLDPSDSTLIDFYRKACELYSQGQDFVMMTRLVTDRSYIKGTDKCLCSEGVIFGNESDSWHQVLTSVRANNKTLKIHMEGDCLIEPVFNYETACIIGAGHVAQKIAQYTKDLDFFTVVVDDRAEFANEERFPNADLVKVVPSYKDLLAYIEIGSNSYVMIVTRGHAYDREVLGQVLKTKAKYIGMIGSMRKKETTYNLLREEGFTEEDLKRVYCPIGLSIHAQTPEEIAVSIAAELIQVRRG